MRLDLRGIAAAMYVCMYACNTFAAAFVASHKGLLHAPSRSRNHIHKAVSTSLREPGTAPLDWPSLGFKYHNTNAHVQYTWKNGQWSDAKLVEEPFISLHIACAALHYGQSVFEGLKAFALEDGSVAVFRPDENGKRLHYSAERLLIPPFDVDEFVEGVKRCVRANIEYVPPYGSGGSLYIRPILFGSGPRIGLGPSDEYHLLIMCTPAGEYYRGGLVPVTAVIEDQYDRAAPRGVGDAKVAGNYAADLLASTLQKKKGFSVSLYLDARERQYIEEFSTSNFIGISAGGGTYVTPDSRAILKSITNKSLMQLAEGMGLKVEQRPIHYSELSSFSEVGACGTAVVVTPVNKIVFGEKEYVYNGGSKQPGPVLEALYNRMRAVQQGKEPDTYNWLFPL